MSEDGDPAVKDVWVEIDYMPGYAPSTTVRTNAANVFQTDGNIRIHHVVDTQIPYTQWVSVENNCAGAANCINYTTLKDSYFSSSNPERKPYFHYQPFVNAQFEKQTSSGFGWFYSQKSLVSIGHVLSPPPDDATGYAHS